MIQELAEGSRQFTKRGSRKSSNADTSELSNQVSTLASLVKELVLEKKKGGVARVCGICSASHPTDTCPTLQENEVEDVNAMGYKVKEAKEGMILTLTLIIQDGGIIPILGGQTTTTAKTIKEVH